MAVGTRFAARVASIVTLAACAGILHAADDYPSKTGRLILPFGVGGSTDVIARIFAQRFSEAWGQMLVIDNRAGAGGILGTEIASRAAPDGYTILVYGINHAVAPSLYAKLPYDAQRDFIPVSLYATMPNILCIHPALPVKSVGGFVKLAKANPGKYKYASSGVGASPHLTMELFKSVAGIDLLHVPYKASSQAYTDTISGQVQGFFFNLPGPLPHIKSGRLRALAVTSPARAEQVPEVPTIKESGVADFEVTVWVGYAMPKGTAKSHLAKVHAAMMTALAAPELKQRFFDAGVAAAPTSPEEFARFIAAEQAKWKKAVALSGAKVE